MSEENEVTPEQEYDAGWQEHSAEAEEKASTPETEEEVDTEAEEEELPEEEIQDSDESEEVGEKTPAELEQRLSETQRWGHELSGKVKELEAKLAAQEQGKATQAEVDEAQRKKDEAQSQLAEAKEGIFKEFPEFKPLLDPLMDTIGKLEEQVSELSQSSTVSQESLARSQALTHFESNVKPKVVEAVPEFNDIVASEDYWQWAARQRPALQTAAMYSDSPDDIIWALNEFKKANSGGEIKAEKEKQAQQKAKRKKAAHSPKPGSQSFSKSGTDKSKQTYDEAWEDLQAEAKKHGGKLPRVR
jgi:hypothetical protein